MEVVNNIDKEYYEGRFYTIYLGSYGEHQFKVYGYNDIGSVLDALGAYCRDKGYLGLLSHVGYKMLLADCDLDEDIFNENWYPVNGGEYHLNICGLNVIEGQDKLK